MTSRLEELGEIGSVKKTSRGPIKKAFIPVDANHVENPLNEPPAEEDSPLTKKEMFKAKVKEKLEAAEKEAAEKDEASKIDI